MEEFRAVVARLRKAQNNPTPSRSRQPCYSCKGPWEPDHRCRGRDQKHTIEACHDSDDEDLEQSDDDSDSCTEASNSDSCTEADDSISLEEDGDPCVVDGKSGEQDDNTCISADISHGVDDPTPQQSGDTSGEPHVLAPILDELPMVAVTYSSPFHTPMIATSHEDICHFRGDRGA
jgi:hypothetical protein